MKNILLILIVLMSIITCKARNINTTDKNLVVPKKIVTSIDTIKTQLPESEKEKILRSKINKRYRTELAKCSKNTTAVTDFNGKTEFWNICETEGYRILLIESHGDSNLCHEAYFEQNNELIYAEESIKYMPINHYIQQLWTCQFYVKNGELLTIMSLGHGKTENDNWDPELIFEMYKNRIAELEKIKKE